MERIRGVRVADVASEAGVSIATVDRVLNERDGVRRETRQRILAVIARLNVAVAAPDAIAKKTAGVRVDFVVPFGAGPSIEESLKAAVDRIGEAVGGGARWHYYRRFDAMDLAEKIREIGSHRPNGIAFSALEHPVVRAAVDDVVHKGVRAIAIQSDLTGSRRTGYVGNDNRAAGRTAAYLMGRFLGPRAGKVAILAGSHLYRSHGEREMGFRGVAREDFRGLKLLDLVTGNDDPDANYQMITELLGKNPDLIGIYAIGSGISGVVQALHEQKRHNDVVFIAHHLSSETRQCLFDGTIDAVIHQNMRRLVEAAVGMILRSSAEQRVESEVQPFELIFRENVST